MLMETVIVDLHLNPEGRTLVKWSWPNEGFVPLHGIPRNYHHEPGIFQLGFGLWSHVTKLWKDFWKQ